MTKYLGRGAAAFAAILACACTPLEQAPLIYSAAEKGGIFISTSPSSTAVVDMSIGYSVIDTAYVPVEVSKHCESATPGNCPADTFGMKDVRGNATVKNSVPPDAAHIQNLTDAYSVAQAKQKDFQLALTAAQTKQSADQQLVTAAAAADNLVATDQTNATAADAAAVKAPSDATLAANSKAANDKLAADKNAADTARAKASGINTAADAQAVTDAQLNLTNGSKTTNDALKAVQDAFGGVTNVADDKGDALSVYGSFNDNSNGSQTGASLTLGKVFSTGVAAQNVSLAANANSTAACLSNAVTAANLVSDASAKQTVLKTAIEACGAKPAN